MILRISSDKDDRRGLFWVWNFRFRDFWGYEIIYHLTLSGYFYGSEIRHGILWGFDGTPKGFFWVLTLSPIRSSLSPDIRITPPPPGHGIPLYITGYHYTSRTISLFEPMIVRTKINTWLELKCSKKYGRFSTKSSLFHHLPYEPFLL